MKRAIILSLIILVASIVIQIPLHNRSVSFFDEGVTFNIAESISQESVLYQDKVTIIAPGIYFFMALVYKIFGISYLASRYAMAAVFSGAAIMVFLISRRLMTEWIAFVIGLVFVIHRVWAFPVWNMIGYSTFSMFFFSLVLYSLLRFNKNPRLSTACAVGFLGAMATLFKQDYGGFTVIGVLLYLFVWPWLHQKNTAAPEPGFSRTKLLAAYVAGGVIVCVPVFVYFALNGALTDFFQNTLVVPLTVETVRESTPLLPLRPFFQQDQYLRAHTFEYYPAVSFMHLLSSYFSGSSPGFLYRNTPLYDQMIKLIHYSPYIAILGVGGMLIRRFMGRVFSLESEDMVATCFVSASLFATQHSPFDFAHLMQMFLPIFVLIGCLAEGLRRQLVSRKPFYYAILGGSGLLLGIYVFYSIMGVRFLVETFSDKLEGPRAGIYMDRKNRDACEKAIRFIQVNTSLGEPIFVLGYHGLFYFLAQRPNPTRFDNLWPIELFPGMNKEIMEIIERERVMYLVKVDKIRPALGAFEDFAPEIAEYANDKFFVERIFGGPRGGLRIIVMKRKPDAG